MRGYIKWTGLVATVVASTATGMFYAHSEQEKPPTPTSSEEALRLAAPGRVEPRGERRVLGARTSGMLTRLHVEENQRVEENQLLAEVDRTELEAELTSAKEAVSLSQAELSRLVNGARSQEKQAAHARLEGAGAEVTYAQKEFDRIRALVGNGTLPTSELDQISLRLNAAQARRQEAVEQLALLEAAARKDELRIAYAKVRLAEAHVAQVEAMLEKTYVRSPVAGVVLAIEHHEGEIVSAQPPTVMFVIGDTSQLTVRTEIDELDVARVHEGDRVEVRSDAYPGKRFSGRVSRVDQLIGPKTLDTGHRDEREDRLVLPVIVDLDPGVELPVGLRVEVFSKFPGH